MSSLILATSAFSVNLDNCFILIGKSANLSKNVLKCCRVNKVVGEIMAT